MQEFYKKALYALIVLVIADALLAWFFIQQSYLTLSVLPAHSDSVRWHYEGYSDARQGGSSTVRIDAAERNRLRFDINLTNVARHPYASAELLLDDGKGAPALADWSKYSTITFLAKCAPANSMGFAISTFDEKVSTLGELATYRAPGTFFSCSETGVQVALDLTRLTIPDWWLNSMKLDLTSQGYALDKVAKIVFGTTFNSPRNVDSHVEISEVTLHGRDYRYIAWLAAILLASWSAFGICCFRAYFRAHTASLDARMKIDLLLFAYRQLTLEPYKDKEKAAILKFIATNYTNTELDMERVVSATGANRVKVNEVLKSELRMTFTSYLNKLRLTEAARLLAEKSNAAIAEIAYSVGYANVPYFNRLFKEEYGCTPKAFRARATRQEEATPPCPAESSAPSGDTPG